ncbi:MAG: mechanosensitive ion channel family protein, partial [Salaquimonas sp.]
IKRITNFSRDWVMMKLPLRLTYDTDVERVRKLVKKLGQELLEDETIGDLFLQPLKSQGVYKMEDSAMIVRVKFMTKPGDQFIARKAIYAAVRELFEKEGIKFAHREVTVRVADDRKTPKRLTVAQKKAAMGAAREVIEDEPNLKGSKAASKYDDM